MESYGRLGHYISPMLWFGTMLFGMERLTSPKKWRLEPRIFLNVNGNPSFPLLSLSNRRLSLSYGAATTFKGVMFAIVLPLVPMFHTEAHNLPFRILNEQKLVPETLLRNVSGNCFHSDLISALGSNTVLKSWVKDEVEARSKQVQKPDIRFFRSYANKL